MSNFFSLNYFCNKVTIYGFCELHKQWRQTYEAYKGLVYSNKLFKNLFYDYGGKPKSHSLSKYMSLLGPELEMNLGNLACLRID